MSKTPSFHRMPWYPRDFHASTLHWPLVARAIYRELLDAQWDIGGIQVGTLPQDEETLRAVARCSKAEWKAGWGFVGPKFPIVEGGGRRNAKLEEHRAKAVKVFEGQQRAARTTNARRWMRVVRSDDGAR